MRVLVTGATGLIGRHTVTALRERGDHVRAFQRGGTRSHLEGIETVQGDVRSDQQMLCNAASDCEAIVHLAGRGDVGESRRDPVGYAELNATGTLHALMAARECGGVFVLASTQRVYPLQAHPCSEDQRLAPDSPYGYAKWVAELWCRMAAEQFGVSARVLRFFSVYGPGQQANGGSGVVSIFANAALRGDPLIVESGGRRDFTDVRDVARGIIAAIENAKACSGVRVYNIATGLGTSFAALAETIIALTRSTSTIRYDIREPEGRDLIADTARASADLAFQARIPLDEGLEHYLQWLKQQSCC